MDASSDCFWFEEPLGAWGAVYWNGYRIYKGLACYSMIFYAENFIDELLAINVLEKFIKVLVHGLDIFFWPEEVFACWKVFWLVFDFIWAFLD